MGVYSKEEGKDFKIYGGPYTSIRDVRELKKEFYSVVLNNMYGIEVEA